MYCDRTRVITIMRTAKNQYVMASSLYTLGSFGWLENRAKILRKYYVNTIA